MKHQAWADALGREIEADEADSSNNMTIGTCYKYDALNDLTEVDQGSQTRTFTYDGVPRKTAETTPEAGTTNFYFTTSGGALCSGDPQKVCRRTDARSITTTYAYDALNRLTSKTYSDTTPAASFYYDEASFVLNHTTYTLTNTKNRLSHTSAASGTAVTIHSYDTMGRTADIWQCTPFNCSSDTIWNMHYNYDLAGDISSWASPAGYTITNTITNAQRISQITSSLNDATHPGTLVSSITYAPQGAVSTLLDGCSGTGCTQRQETYDYNNRLQAVRIQLGTSATPNANNCLVYNYYSGIANPTSCAVPSQATSGNDGTVVGHFFQDTTNSSLGHTASYTYDNVMRLATSVATGAITHNLTFSYDRYGNMTCVLGPQSNGPCPSYTYSTATNRITNANYTYDAAGDLTQDGPAPNHTYQWDAENRMKSVDGGTTASYTYNAFGERVEKNVGGAYTETFYDASGEPVAENNRTSWTQSFVLFGGRHLVHYQNNATYFTHANTLGSTGTVTDYSGAVAQDKLFYPWGQDWTTVGTTHEERFASLQHRDGETSLDPTIFRFFSSNQGRWFSADPVHGQPCTPQSQNRYAYVANGPTNRTDPRGNQYCDPMFDPYCNYCDFYGCYSTIYYYFYFYFQGTVTIHFQCPNNKSSCCPYYANLALDPRASIPEIGADLTELTVCNFLTINSCRSNCIRQCLVEYSQKNCDQKVGPEERTACRVYTAHAYCNPAFSPGPCDFWKWFPGYSSGDPHITFRIPPPIQIDYWQTVDYSCSSTKLGGRP